MIEGKMKPAQIELRKTRSLKQLYELIGQAYTKQAELIAWIQLGKKPLHPLSGAQIQTWDGHEFADITQVKIPYRRKGYTHYQFIATDVHGNPWYGEVTSNEIRNAVTLSPIPL